MKIKLDIPEDVTDEVYRALMNARGKIIGERKFKELLREIIIRLLSGEEMSTAAQETSDLEM